MIDEMEFFREATLRLCRHLEIEEGLQACIEYIGSHMPADALYLERYDQDYGAMRIVARATAEHGEKMDQLIHLSPEAEAAMEKMNRAFWANDLPPVIVINRPADEPVTRLLEESLGLPLSSAMSLPLIVEGRPLGALAVLAAGDDRYTERHARLYSMLREPFFVALSNTLKHAELLRMKELLTDDNRYLYRELQRISGDEIVGADFGLREVMQKVRHVAPTESPVLLMGETGVGKDVIANAIHLGSARREGPFIPVNCGAIPESLIDSELFGHEKGSFTGALSRRRGRFERAEGGTVMLDEIGEMPLEAQVRLLRVLQHRELERVGGTERIPLDIRIIAASNRDLETMVKEGRFREDLWFRLNVFPVTVPPLRERACDIPALVHYFIERKAKELKLGHIPRLAEGAIDELMAYRWPGNVRELENLIERSMILCRGDRLQFDDLSGPDQELPPAATPSPDGPPLTLDSVTSRHIRSVLEMTGGKIHGPGGAGELLAVNPNTLRYKMRKLGIPFRRKDFSR